MALQIPEMAVLYISDEARPCVMSLEQLFGNFHSSDTWADEPQTYEDILWNLADRGLWEGVHENGRCCIINLKQLAEHEPCRAALAHAMEK